MYSGCPTYQAGSNIHAGHHSDNAFYRLPVFPPPCYPQLYEIPDPAPYIRELLSIPPNAPIHLGSLVDEPIKHSRPGYTMKQLAAVAIYSSQDGKATAKEIQYAIMARFAYFRTDSRFPATLKDTLSKNALFALPKPSKHEAAMIGGFWVVDVRDPTGRRARKQGVPSGTSKDDTKSDVSN